MEKRLIARGQASIQALNDANMLDWVKEWDTNKTIINSSTVITPKLFAGLKESDGTLTGVAIGHFTLSIMNTSGFMSTEMINGIYGFRNGFKTFSVDNSGNVEIGRENQMIRYNAITGRIEFGSDVTLNWVNAINTAKTEAINSAASTAQTKADAAKDAAITQAATQTNQKISEIQLGSDNLLPNSDFRYYSINDTIGWDNNLNGNYVLSNWNSGYNGGVAAPSKGYHAHMNTRKFGFPVLEYINKNSSVNQPKRWMGIATKVYQKEKLMPGMPYTFSTDIMTDMAGMYIHGGVYSYKKESTIPALNSGTYRLEPSALNQWQRVSYTFTLDPDIDLNKLISFYIYGHADAEGTAWIKNVSLQAGTKGSWVRCWSDVKRDVDDAKKIGTDARNVADAITNKAISEGWATKLTFIGSTGIFTGTLSSNIVNSIRINASQITAGTIRADRIDIISLTSSLITASNIEALVLNVVRGKIGGWSVDADSIFQGTKNNTVGAYTAGSGAITIGINGIRGYKWRLDATGAGALAGGNINWDASGAITFSSAVSMNWTNAATTALNSAKSYADTKKNEAVNTASADATNKVNVLSEATLPKLTKITATGVYTGMVEATQIRANSITAGQINVSSIQSAVVTAAVVNGLNCMFTKGTIGGFVMTTERLYDAGKHIVLQSGSARRIGICKAANAVLAGGTACVMLFYNSDTDWGLYGHDGTNHIFSLGSSNQIAGWKVNASQIYKNNVYLGADGSIVNSTRWKLNNDGSGQLANGAITWTAAGTVTFSSSVSLNWTNAATTALNSAKSYADTKKSEAISSAASDATTKADAAKELASAMAFGKMLYRDPTFYKGDNGTNTYNNSQNEKVIITHEVDNTAPNDSKHVLVIKNIGPSDPHCGGFYFGNMTSYRKIFITRIIAKIPIGRNISFHSNPMGTGGTQKWLTPVAGIGDWCVYICKVKCGTANFASTHFFTITGSVGTTSSPVEWRLAYATVFDVTSTEKYPTTIDGDGIYTASLNASQITAGTISADRIAAGSINSSKLDADSIRASIINVSYINGLTCNFVRGTIGGFLITADSINTHPIGSVGALPIQIRSSSSGSGYWYNGSYKPKGVTLTWRQSENAGHIILGEIATNGSTIRTGFMGLQMMAWDGVEYFCLSTNYTRSGSKEVYNRIAGWAFDHTHIWKNSVSLGSDGSIYNGVKWRLNNDGSGKIANGNICWDTSGTVTFSSSVSLNWKNDIEAAKSTNYGYRYVTTLVINGESDKYYPVVIKGGDQTTKRDIFINRAFSEQAPSDWANSTTHMGGLNLHIKANFGSWGGTSYSWNIQELEEEYSRMFAGAIICGYSCMFAVFLRGGGATGAVYHVYSNQSLTERPFNESPVPEQAPQICYNYDLIFKSPNGNGGYYLASAPAPRTLTSDVETEIKAHRYAASTHIDSNGIYTGTLTAGQITAGTISTDRLDAASIRANIINTSYINGLTCTFVRGSIGGWNLDSGNIYASTPNNGHRVYIRSNGYLFNDDGSTDYWALKPDGSAVFGYGKIQFYNDGSGYLANRNITWDVSGNVTMTGAINANAGSIGGFTIAFGRIGSTASGSGSGGGLAIYNDLFRVGSSSSYVLFGDNTFPTPLGGMAATGRIVNNKYNSYNYGLYIDVRNGDKNIGVYSNAPCMANAFIGNKVTNVYFSGTSYTWDFSKNNIFFVYASSNYNVNLPSSSSVAYMFGLSSLPSDFGYMFTIIYNYNWSYRLTFMNLRDQNGNVTNVSMERGDTLTLLCANYPNFHYQIVHRQN